MSRPKGADVAATRVLLVALLVLGLVTVPVAFAGVGGSGATASGVKNQVKKLQKQLAQLQQQVNGLAQQTGPQGPQGPQGSQGPEGPEGDQGPPGTGGDAATLDGFDSATASGAQRIYVSGADGNLPDNTVDSDTVDLESLSAADLGPSSVVGGAGGDVQDDSLINNDLAPNSVGASELATNAVIGGLDGDVQDDTITTDDVLGNSLNATDLSNTLGTMFAGSDINPTEAGATDDFINLVDGTSSSTEGSEDLFSVPINVIVSNLRAEVDAPPGAGNDRWTIAVRDDGTSTALSCQIDEAAVTCTNNTQQVIAAGSRIAIRVDSNAEGAPADPNAASSLLVSFAITP